MGDVLVDAKLPTVDSEHFRVLPKQTGFEWALKGLTIAPNTVEIQVETSSAAYLVFNNVHAPGWEVYVNGDPAEMLRTNRIFQGVFLNNSGLHVVEFKYRPKQVVILILLPYLVLILCLSAWFVHKIKNV